MFIIISLSLLVDWERGHALFSLEPTFHFSTLRTQRAEPLRFIVAPEDRFIGPLRDYSSALQSNHHHLVVVRSDHHCWITDAAGAVPLCLIRPTSTVTSSAGQQKSARALESLQSTSRLVIISIASINYLLINHHYERRHTAARGGGAPPIRPRAQAGDFGVHGSRKSRCRCFQDEEEQGR